MFVWSLVGGAGFGLVWLVVVFAGWRLSAGQSKTLLAAAGRVARLRAAG
jgi:hypothetical protein